MRNIKPLVIIFGLFISSYAFAGQWKPLCVEGSTCNLPYKVSLGGGASGYHPSDRFAAGPFVTTQDILFLHSPINSIYYLRSTFRWTLDGLQDLNGKFRHVSDVNSIELPSGKKLTFSLTRVDIWQDSEGEAVTVDWNGLDAVGLNLAALTQAPVFVGGTLYIGMRTGGGQWVYFSEDEGLTWNKNGTDIRIGDDRYNLLANPEGDALWAISSEFFEFPGSLWESADHGANWVQVDDGSFPPLTVRVVHDPADQQVSYALTSSGLFISENRGVSWQATSLTEGVHGLVFIGGEVPETRTMVVGTDTGVKASIDNAATWVDVSKGLLSQPHTVTYGHDQLIATGDSGYFTCNTVDCIGLAQSMPSEPDRGLVDVVEFYHPDLDHYFITATDEEATAIDQGAAGPGWVRTGEQFNGWSLGSSGPQVSDVCRFYGSLKPGPNSHFYSVSALECRVLMDQESITSDDKPRWNFEGYAFSMRPPALGDQEPCPESFLPVYRAYNDGFQQGKDSNHRYMTNPDLMDSMVAQGWIDEGVAFCSPNQ